MECHSEYLVTICISNSLQRHSSVPQLILHKMGGGDSKPAQDGNNDGIVSNEIVVNNEVQIHNQEFLITLTIIGVCQIRFLHIKRKYVRSQPED